MCSLATMDPSFRWDDVITWSGKKLVIPAEAGIHPHSGSDLVKCCEFHFPSESFQAAINVFDGSDSSKSFLPCSTPATGKPFGSSKPICTSTLA